MDGELMRHKVRDMGFKKGRSQGRKQVIDMGSDV